MSRKKRPPLDRNGHVCRCHWCDRELESTQSSTSLAATRDHLHPKCLGGVYWVWSCVACNQVKGNMNEAEWGIFRDRNPGWWRLYKKRCWSFVIRTQPAWITAEQWVA